MIIQLEGKETLVRLKQGRIEDEKSDVIINWLNADLRSGPQSFYHIHNKAGVQLFNAMLTYEVGVGNLKPTDCFTTLAGQLESRNVFHVVIPLIKTMYAKAFYNLASSIKTHKERNLCRTISIFIPEEANSCLAGIKEFLLDCGLDEVVIMYATDGEKNKILEFMRRFEHKLTFKDKLNLKTEKIMTSLGSKRLPAKLEKMLWGRKQKEYGEGNSATEKDRPNTKPNT